MPDILWNDAETFNGEKDIKVGTYEYARTCEILIIAYAINDGPVKLWDLTKEPMPADLTEVTQKQDTIYVAHHSNFDRIVWRESGLFPGHCTRVENWICTMAKSMLHGFPGSLDALCKIFRLDSDQAKMKEGKKLINRFCKPAPKNHKADRYTAETHPEEWALFCKYAIRDVGAMRKISSQLPLWNWDVREFHIDQLINDRGFRVDTGLVSAGAKAAAEEKIALAERFRELTTDEVSSPTQREKFKNYLNNQFGLELENTQKATLEPLLKTGELDPVAHELIEIALMANKTSTAKYAALEPSVSPDNNFRGGLKFSGAQRTRRWSGLGFQVQNLRSKDLPDNNKIELYIDALKLDIHDILFAGELMEYGSAALRGVLVAPEGQKLVVSDLSNIEGRVSAFLAGEKWKLKAFSDFDKGRGDDLYRITAGRILGKAPNAVTKEERNSFGKISELSLGYMGGAQALQNFASGRGVSFAEHWENIEQSVSDEIIEKAKENWSQWGKKRAGDIPEDEWIASEVVKLSWRSNNPEIAKLWYACGDAAENAINNPGKTFKAGELLTFRYVKCKGHKYLLMVLPSKKCLVYFDPKIEKEKISIQALNTLFDKMEERDVERIISDHANGARSINELIRADLDMATCNIESLYQGQFERIFDACLHHLGELPRKPKILYWGVDSVTKQWTRQNIYSGKFLENAAQSMSRDILMQGIFGAEAAGYKCVLSVHDEVVCEVPDTDDYTEKELSQILATQLPWTKGLPLAADGFEAYRYRK